MMVKNCDSKILEDIIAKKINLHFLLMNIKILN
jgi:hypothetical protein